ncbi:MAG TPA: phage tail protein [Blastocatellia bacterium]|jgi:phage tail-like protein|nr:phage tail protein [Blastocatellia bacterium]
MSDEMALFPLHVFRFEVDFKEDPLKAGGGTANVPLCSGAFSECTGLEATMEPKVIKEGGRNYGAAQRVGPVTFATVVLKRGMTTTRDLWTWFDMVTNGGKYAYRLSAFITVYGAEGTPALKWKLEKALPIKFKAADLNARGTEVGVEELHLAHEGLTLEPRG